MKVSLNTYLRYSSGNYGAHAMCLRLGDLDLYFSYSTVIAFSAPDHGLCVSENLWGPTTGKHLKAIVGHRSIIRMTRTEFEAALAEALKARDIEV